jgi:large subunit ribosomal protein L10
MSKYVKNLITDDLKQRFHGIQDALVVSVAGLDANKNYLLRKQLRGKQVNLLVVKNSMARRAAEGTPLAVAFEQAEGSLAVVWGGEDIVSLAKIVAQVADDKNFAPFEPRGGVMDGARLSATQVRDVSKWPSRQEQLSLLVGQILSPGAMLSSQLLAVGGALASQIKQIGEPKEGAAEAEAEAEAAPAT